MAGDWPARYVGLPYLKGGRDRRGIDCWGLVRLVWREQYGFEAPGFEGVGWDNLDPEARRKSIALIVECVNIAVASYIRVPLGEQQPGDGVSLRMRGAEMHCGVMISPTHMIHIEEGVDSCIEDLRRPLWGYRSQTQPGRIAAFYRPPGIIHHA